MARQLATPLGERPGLSVEDYDAKIAATLNALAELRRDRAKAKAAVVSARRRAIVNELIAGRHRVEVAKMFGVKQSMVDGALHDYRLRRNTARISEMAARMSATQASASA